MAQLPLPTPASLSSMVLSIPSHSAALSDFNFPVLVLKNKDKEKKGVAELGWGKDR